jgi:peptidoglycan/LPS O-acetylase OafA/YrhL
LFHAELPGFSGGFVGVDIFFVISGFLITSIIQRDLNLGRFSIASFYERRVRRIFPAFFAMLFVVIAVGYMLFDAIDFARLGRNAASATAFVSNLVFWRGTGYFAPAAATNPLLHTWSLAVEEQFYLFFPVFMFLAFRFARTALVAAVIVGTAVSFVLSAYGAFRYPGATFYLLPTRAWELMVGALLALGVPAASASARWAMPLGGIALALILVPATCYSESTPFPGLAALLPVGGTAVLIWGGGANPDGAISRMLSMQPLRFLGLISYSLYLWHWPVVAFWKYLSPCPIAWVASVSIIGVSIVLGAVSWRLVEQPFRGPQGWVRNQRTMLQLGGTAMLVAIAAGAGIWRSGGLPGRFDLQAAHQVAIAKSVNTELWDKFASWESTTERLGEDTTIKVPIVGSASARPTFAFIGDSHARALIPAIELQAMRVGVSGYVVTRKSTPPLIGVGVKQMPHGDDGFDEITYHEAVMKVLADEPGVRTVILAARWPAYIRDHYTERGEDRLDAVLIDGPAEPVHDRQARAEVMERGLRRMVDRLHQLGKNVVIVGCVPEIGVDVPRAFGVASRLPWLSDFGAVPPTLEAGIAKPRPAPCWLDSRQGLESRLWSQTG